MQYFYAQMSLQAADSLSTPYGNLITPLAVDITWETNERLHVKIYDPYDYRWEIPSEYVYVCKPCVHT